MKITVLSYIGTEDDIVESFVRHTLRYADKMIVVSTENGETRRILQRLEQEGLALTVMNHEPAYHDQHEVLSALLPSAAAEADWILPLDSDEFVTGDLESALANTDQTQPAAIAWRTYVPTTTDDMSETAVPRRIRHRRSKESPQFTKIVIPSSIITTGATITQGNHAVMDANGECMEGHILPDVFLAHFPVRSPVQMQEKIARSWPAVERNPHKLPNEASHWKTLHERFAGRQIDVDTLTEIARTYAAPSGAQCMLIEDPIAY